MKDKKKYTPFYGTYLSLCEQAGLSATAAAKAAGISSGAPTAWKNKGAIPKPEQRQKLCTLFGVTEDELLGYVKKETPLDPKDELSKEAREIGAAFDASVPGLRAAIKALLSRGEAPKLLEEDIKITCPLNQREQVIRQPYYLVGGKRMAVLNNGCENCHQCQECELCQARVMRKISD